ncbi:hypothetical protein [Fodinicola feengrottensis]|uniref:hypothetical protein n=1 Tax=Fodinicola feengrottensis TaxID=435914 RepID=UPI0036F19B4C
MIAACRSSSASRASSCDRPRSAAARSRCRRMSKPVSTGTTSTSPSCSGISTAADGSWVNTSVTAAANTVRALTPTSRGRLSLRGPYTVAA